MNALTIKQKFLAAAVLLAMLPLLALLQSGSGVLAARLASGLLVLAALGWWGLKGKRRAFELPPRLSIIGRVGLSARSGLALVEVDGVTFLVAHGEGYAQLTRTAPTPRRPRLVTDEMAQIELRAAGDAS